MRKKSDTKNQHLKWVRQTSALKFAVIGTVCLILCNTPALASERSDQCRDILVDGTLKLSSFKSNQNYQLIEQSRLKTITTENTGQSNSYGAGATVYGVPLSGEYETTKSDNRSRVTDQSNFRYISSNNEVDTLLSTGDPVIVGAWTKCMTERAGGLAMRFETKNGRDAILFISWIPGRAGTMQGYRDAKLFRDYHFPPEIEVRSGQDCLLARRSIVGECQVAIRLPDSLSDLEVSFNTNRGVSANAYLPPRLVYDANNRIPYRFGKSDLIKRTFKRERNPIKVRWTAQLPKTFLDQGWRFDANSAQFVVEKTYGGPHHTCKYRPEKLVSGDSFQITYEYVARTSWEDKDDRNTSLKCEGRPTANLIRHRWLPMR